MFFYSKLRRVVEPMLNSEGGSITPEIFEESLKIEPMLSHYRKRTEKGNESTDLARYHCHGKIQELAKKQKYKLGLDFIQLGLALYQSTAEDRYAGLETKEVILKRAKFWNADIVAQCYSLTKNGHFSRRELYSIIDLPCFETHPNEPQQTRLGRDIMVELIMIGFILDNSRDKNYFDPQRSKILENADEFGELKSQIICPHCQTKGQVYAKKGQETSRSREADLVGSVIGKKQVTTREVTVLSCTNCEMQWNA